MNKKLAIKCTQCVYAVNNNHCGLRGFRSDFNVNYCSAQNTDKLPNGFELQEDGYFSWINRKTKYPKTYEECCKVVNASPYIKLVFNIDDGQKYSYDVDNLQCYENIRRIKICRDAYWKIAGKELGLGKPWEPKFGKYIHYSINFYLYKDSFVLHKGEYHSPVNRILVFPTTEMRDAFYENFKDLIEKCKKLL